MIYELLAPFLLLLHALTFIDAFSSPVLQLKAPASSFHTRISSASRDQRFFAETHSHCSSTSSKLPPLHCNDRIYRDDFLGLVRKLALGSLGVFTAAKANPANAARPTSPNRPNLAKFIDVEVDLGGGLILTIRQPFADDTGAEKVASDGGDRQGTYVWPAGSDLAKFLLSDVGRGLVSGKRVVELGAGTAIAGLAASVAGASATYLTDGMTEVLAVTGDTIKRNEQSLALAQRSNPRVFSRANIALRLTSGLSSIETNPEPRLSTERLRWGNRGDIASLLSQASNSATSGGFDVVIGAEVTYLSASLDPLLSTMEELLSSSVLVTPESQRHSMQVLGDGPVGLLTYTPHLTAFDGGGVAELEDKARKHGLHVTHFRSDPDVDTRLMALTLMSAEEKSSSDTPMGSARSVS